MFFLLIQKYLSFFLDLYRPQGSISTTLGIPALGYADEHRQKFKFLTLHNITSHERGSVLIALYTASGQILLDLQTEQIPRELLLKPRRVRCVELNTEAQCRL